LGFDIWAGTILQLGMSTWWKVARSAGVCIREGRQGVKIDPWTHLLISVGSQTFDARVEPFDHRQIQLCILVAPKSSNYQES